jgi:cell division protein FtsB
MKKEQKEAKKMKKIAYHRLTFILSVIGFIGSIGFYLGVLKQLYHPSSDRQQIEQLKQENQQLKESIYDLTEELATDA